MYEIKKNDLMHRVFFLHQYVFLIAFVIALVSD